MIKRIPEFEEAARKYSDNFILLEKYTQLGYLDEMFEEQYTGDLYAAHYQNTWITYNPFKRNKTASAVIPLQYNTAQSISVAYQRYSTSVISEHADHIDIYLNNYNSEFPLQTQNDVITVTGASEKPTYKFTDRGIDIINADVTEDWSGGIYTLTVNHNGPVDVTINCSGGGVSPVTVVLIAAITVVVIAVIAAIAILSKKKN